MVIPFLLLLVAVTFSVTGELLLKHGMNVVGELSFHSEVFFPTLRRAFSNPYVLVGFASIFTGSIFWLSVISRVALSYAYPMLSVSYILVVLASWLLLGEQITANRILGVLIICAGVYVVFRSV
ncbi:MAG: EamA family transporter [Chloroflexi bacterium]|nr:EamA family transporter [Chloroflexota bacterium]